MKKILFLLCLFSSFIAFGQQDIPANYVWYKYTYGTRVDRGWFDKSLHIPRDTVYTKSGIALIGSTLYVGDSVRWYQVTGGGGGSTNSNVGSGFGLAVSNTNNIKTILFSNGLTGDSLVSNTIRATLGGTLSGNTTIDLSTHTLSLTNVGGLTLNESSFIDAKVKLKKDNYTQNLMYIGEDMGSQGRADIQIYSRDTITAANVGSRKAYLSVGEKHAYYNEPLTTTFVGGDRFDYIMHIKDSVNRYSVGGDFGWARESGLLATKYPGFSGRSVIQGGTVDFDAVPAHLSQIQIFGTSGGNNLRLRGWWSSHSAFLLAPTGDSADNTIQYMAGGVVNGTVLNNFVLYDAISGNAGIKNPFYLYGGVSRARNYLKGPLALGASDTTGIREALELTGNFKWYNTPSSNNAADSMVVWNPTSKLLGKRPIPSTGANTNIFNSNGILTGNRLLTGNAGSYSLTYDSLPFSSTAYSGSSYGQLSISGSAAGLTYNNGSAANIVASSNSALMTFGTRKVEVKNDSLYLVPGNTSSSLTNFSLLATTVGGGTVRYTGATTFLTSLNGLTAGTQTFATGTSGSDVNINSSTSTHTINIPTSSASNRGALASADFITFNAKLSTTPSLAVAAALGSAIKGETVGMSIADPLATSAFTDGRENFSVVYVPQAGTLTGVKWYQVTQGSYTADNENRLGLYTYSGGTLTLVASCADDGTLWKGASSTWVSKAFTTPYIAAAGIYFVGAVYNSSAQTTAPAIGGKVIVNSGSEMDFTNSGKTTAFGATATLTSSQAMSGLSANATIFYFTVY